MHFCICNIFFFFFFKFIYFNWRIITLQYCDGFCLHPHESMNQPHFDERGLQACFQPSWGFSPSHLELFKYKALLLSQFKFPLLYISIAIYKFSTIAFMTLCDYLGSPVFLLLYDGLFEDKMMFYSS